jgi:acetyltransferase-like isoleucine patch superfamily enzyme
MLNDRSAKKIDASFISIRRLLLLLIATVLCYACAFFVPLLFLYQITRFLNLGFLPHLFLFSLCIAFSYLLLVASMICFSTLFIRVLRVRYMEGEYGTTIKDKTSFKFILSYALYFPTYKVIGFLNLPPIKVAFLRMIGCKIGKNVVLAGDEWIFDPYVTEIGDNTTIGARSLLTAHIGEGHIIIKKIRIGKNVLIGGECFIMPGATIEDNVVVGARSLVLKDTVLKAGKRYAGAPVHEIPLKQSEEPIQ